MEQEQLNQAYHQAVLAFDNKEIKRLLKAGVDINFKNFDGLNAFDLITLTNSVLTRSSKSTLSLLVTEGIDFNSLDAQGLSTGHKLFLQDNQQSVGYLREQFGLDLNLDFGEGATLPGHNLLELFVIANTSKEYAQYRELSFVPVMDARAKLLSGAADEQSRRVHSPWLAIGNVLSNKEIDLKKDVFIRRFAKIWLACSHRVNLNTPEFLDRFYFNAQDLLQLMDLASSGTNHKLEWLCALLDSMLDIYSTELHSVTGKGTRSSNKPTALINSLQADFEAYDNNEKRRILNSLLLRESSVLDQITSIFTKYVKGFKLVYIPASK